jgi:hypothetical protein
VALEMTKPARDVAARRPPDRDACGTQRDEQQAAAGHNGVCLLVARFAR